MRLAAEAAIKMTRCHENCKTQALSISVSFSHVYCPKFITANKDAKFDSCSTNDIRVSLQNGPEHKKNELSISKLQITLSTTDFISFVII